MKQKHINELVKMLNQIEDREQRLMALKDICKEITAGSGLNNRQDVYRKRYQQNHPKANGIYVKTWRKKNSEKYREYMRDYMRRRRREKAGEGDTDGTGKTL